VVLSAFIVYAPPVLGLPLDVQAGSNRSCATSQNSPAHPEMGISREPVLERPRERICQPGKWVPRPRQRLQVIPHRAVLGSEFKQESFLALLGMLCACRVDESEAVRGIDRVHNSAEIQRPQTERMHFDRDHFPGGNRGIRIRYPHPAEIELRPTSKSLTGGRKCRLSLANTSSKQVMREAARPLHLRSRPGAQGKETWCNGAIAVRRPNGR